MSVQGGSVPVNGNVTDSNTSSLVRRLVRTTLNRNGASDSNEQDVDRVFRYALRVVGSSLHASVEPDENAVGDAIRRRLSRQGKPASSGVEFAELHRRFAQQPGLNSRWALLHTLLRVSENTNEENKNLGGADAAAAALLANPLSASAEAGGLPSLSDPQTPSQHSKPRRNDANAVSAVDAVDAVDTARQLANGDGSTLGLEHPGARAVALRELAAESVANLEVSEPELVRDVLFACQGIDGRLVRFSERFDAYTLDENTVCSPGARRLTEKLSEVGWLFKKVRASLIDGELNEQTVYDSDPTLSLTQNVSNDTGSTRQAFRAAVRAELAEYYRLIAVLEAQAQVPMASSLASNEKNENSSSSSSYLSLRRLSVWLAEPTRRLRLLAVLADATKGKKGGALLTALHEHTKHGDPAVVGTVDRLLSQTSVPILNFLKTWVVSGELDDPRDEFFIHHDRTVSEDDLWQHGWDVDLDMLPPFIDMNLARDALNAGKSINFLRRRCSDDNLWANEKNPILVACENAGGLQYGNGQGINALVSEAKTRIDKCLRTTLFDKYKLYDHVFAAKRYLLLGQGDFHAVLMDTLGSDLDEPASTISAYALTGSLETAIRASNAQFDPPFILDKLRVQMQRSAVGQTECGWDVFSLKFATSAPLDVVFTEACMSKYLRIFTFLWRLKRVEHALNATWQTMKPNVAASLERDGAAGDAGTQLANELRRCHTLRGEMHHFVSNLQYYVMFEVLEGSWGEFVSEMGVAQDLDALVAAHDKYLDCVTRKSLLGPKSQLLAHTLGGIFDVILRFRAFADRLYEVAKDAAMRRQLARLRVEKRAQSGGLGGWGSVPGEDAAGGDGLLSLEFVSEMKSQLDAVGDDYAKMLDGFLNLLPLQSHVDLRFLLFRLDFSEFYSNKEKGRK